MGQIFISYRREDSQDATGRIHDHLDMYFGPEATFRDIDNIHGGANFPEVVEAALHDCRMVLAVIGPRWLTATNQHGRRLDDPDDLVRVELRTALARKVAVIPVLVSFASMPQQEQLPPDLGPLALIQSLSVPPNAGFKRGMHELVEQVSAMTGLAANDYPSLLRDSQKAGLVTIKGNFAEDRTVLEEITQSRELMVVMNDGRSWIDSNREILAQRIRDREKITRILLLHPRSNFLDVLIRKNKKTQAQQMEEIQRSFDVLQNIATRPEALDIRGHHGFNPYSLILTANYAFVSPYFLNERGALPLMKFTSHAPSGLYHELRADAQKLFDQATILTQSQFASLP